MKDRIVEHPNRYKLKPVVGENGVYDLEPMPGVVTEVGTAVNKGVLLSDETATLYNVLYKVPDVNGGMTVDDVLKTAALYLGDVTKKAVMLTIAYYDRVAGKTVPYSKLTFTLIENGTATGQYTTDSMGKASLSVKNSDAILNARFPTTFPINEVVRDVPITIDKSKPINIVTISAGNTFPIQWNFNSTVAFARTVKEYIGRRYDIFMVGGGGGGGMHTNGGGGGGGGYTKTLRDVTLPNEPIFTIGAGGYGANYGERGGTGGTTSVNVSGASVSGGNGGDPGAGDFGGIGGDGGSGGGSGRGGGGTGYTGGTDGGKAPVDGGVGQGTTTRIFGEPTGALTAGGGGGSGRNGQPGIGGAGGGGNGSGTNGPQATAGQSGTGGGGGGGTNGSTMTYPGGGGRGAVYLRLKI